MISIDNFNSGLRRRIYDNNNTPIHDYSESQRDVRLIIGTFTIYAGILLNTFSLVAFPDANPTLNSARLRYDGATYVPNSPPDTTQFLIDASAESKVIVDISLLRGLGANSELKVTLYDAVGSSFATQSIPATTGIVEFSLSNFAIDLSDIRAIELEATIEAIEPVTAEVRINDFRFDS